jgi:hypothetical protein
MFYFLVLQEIVWKHFPNPDMPESKREEIKKTLSSKATLVAMTKAIKSY